jgi:signal transduction histidine kinase
VAEDRRAELLERYQRLSNISRDLASTLDLESLLNRIVQAAADLCHAEAASILLYDSVKNEIYFDAATNLSEPMMRGLVVPVEGSIAGWIVSNRLPLIISDTQNDPRHFAKIAKSTNVTTRSMLGVPLIAKDKVVGVLEAINKVQGDFSPEDQDLLMALGAQAAVAIENARLFQQSDLISELVHEVRTPLTSLNTAAQLLSRPDVPDPLRANMIKAIVGETNRLNELTTTFLDLARLESGRVQFQPEFVLIRPLLVECTGLMRSRAASRDVHILLDASDDLPPVRVDPERFKQVVYNLLSNAIKYNRPGGTITVSAEANYSDCPVFPRPRLAAPTEPIPDVMIIRVRDTGVGIPLENLPHIFEKFYRVPGTEGSVQGTGLGLSICKRIVDVHRGRIEVDSRPGEGTEFAVVLPLK